MRVAVYSCRAYEVPFLEAANAAGAVRLHLLDAGLNAETAALAAGCGGACIFVNDRADAPALRALHALGVRVLALRCAGYNQVDLEEAERLGLAVLRVPAYSPHAVAEHTVGLMLTLNRKFHRAYARVRELNFSLGGLMGFDMAGKTVGVVGTGAIGERVCRILLGFGCRVVAHDPRPNPACERMGVRYAPLETLLAESDIVTLHCPLVPATHHLLNEGSLATMRPGAMLINTGRGALVDTRALIGALKRGHLGAVGLDVYEEEGGIFFRDLSDTVFTDDVFARLLTFPNVVITAHQGFFTREAMRAIAETTIANLAGFLAGAPPAENAVTTRMVAR
jgi:D-lactate dehydrogenase